MKNFPMHIMMVILGFIIPIGGPPGLYSYLQNETSLDDSMIYAIATTATMAQGIIFGYFLGKL